MAFLFLGERRSRKAIEMGVSWENGNLSARPLFNALSWHGINPEAHRFENLFIENEDGPLLLRPDAQPLLTEALRKGDRIVAMGNKVASQLTKLDVPHTQIVHPAARGKIRETRLYTAHVGERLLHANQ